MSQKHVQSKHTAKAPSRAPGTLSTTVVIRLAMASVVYAVSLIFNMPEFVSIILLVLAAAAAGYDIVLHAVTAVENGDYFANPVIVVIISVIAFFIGFSIEGAAVILLYQIGMLLLNYASEHTRKAALELLHYQDEEVVSKMKVCVADESAPALCIQ